MFNPNLRETTLEIMGHFLLCGEWKHVKVTLFYPEQRIVSKEIFEIRTMLEIRIILLTTEEH